MKTIRWGIIGCGDVTEVKSGPAFNKIPNSQLVAVMRRDAEKAQDYARRHGVPKWYDNAQTLINDPEIDAVYIATPPDSHHDYTLQVAAAGKPVYVEKPMARTYAECQAMIAACEQAQVPLFVAFYRRRLPSFLKVKELIDTGVIGDIRFVSIQLFQPPQPKLESDNLPWRVQPDIAGGGLFFDLAPHQLDILDYILGPIAAASGQTANQAKLYPAEDIVTAQLRFESGVLGSGTWCFTVADQQRTDRMEIVGSKGKITFAAFDKVPVILETTSGKQQFDLLPPVHIHQPFIQIIVEQLTVHCEFSCIGVTVVRKVWEIYK